MKNSLLVILLICFISPFAHSQVKEFDKLEMYYAQGHYTLVQRKANRLLDKPEYDYSMVPSFYKSLSLFQLLQNDKYYKRNPDKLEEARKLFMAVKSAPDGYKVLNAHMYEVASLKRDLNAWMEDIKRLGNTAKFEKIQLTIKDLFDKIPDIEEGKVKAKDLIVEIDASESSTARSQREAMIEIAKNQMGVPYRYAGEDSKGFDCSGFVTYVMKSQNKEVPRRAVEQYESSKKIKQKQVQPGDLVFFDSGSGINHVGIIVSKKGAPLIMIHASSTKGIVITEIETTDYWKKRLAGFGTYVE